ncbi:hypothetical protein PLIP_a3330 [Pseudoalteromonas lipolytica LMEB 39]|nr:hypothetical protein [Pseudoalteromonas lipolytica LMEB 39]
MHSTELQITLHSGEQVNGKAINLQIISPEGEHLILSTKKGEHAVRLDLIKSVEPR